MADGRIEAMEVRLRYHDDAVAEYQLSAAVVELNGQSCAVAIGHDISERKRMERELIAARAAAEASHQTARGSEVSLRKIIDSSLDSISIRDLGSYVDVNSEFTSLFGYRREEVIGTTGE
jgi:PAS domain-containing protein